MKVMVLGATGATGRFLVKDLLSQGAEVLAVVRAPDRFAEIVAPQAGLTVHEASIHDLSDDEMRALLEQVDGVASCLGHNLSFKGIFGPPRKLVTDVTRRVAHMCLDMGSKGPDRFVLMNTTGNRNRDLNEKVTLGQRVVVGLLRLLLPPQSDNEQAAEVLRKEIRIAEDLGWVVVRPDGLIDEPEVTPYTLHPSPTRDPIFDAGQTSRINVANFMARLFLEDELWSEWKLKMPVIYNAGSS